MSNIFNFIMIIVLVSILFVGFFVYFKAKRNSTVFSFLFFILMTELWFLTNYLFWIFNQTHFTLFLFKLTFFSAVLMSYSIYIFTKNFPIFSVKKKYIFNYIIDIGTILVALLCLTHLMINEISFNNFIINIQYGKLFYIFIIYIVFMLVNILINSYKQYKLTQGINRQQLICIFFGIILFILFTTTTDIFIPLFTKSTFSGNFGQFGLIFVIIAITYAILAHHLFDIRVVIKKTFIYSILLTFVFGVYVLIIFSFTKLFGATTLNQTLIPGILAALFIALGYDPLKKWLTNITENKLFQGEYKPQEVLNNLSKILSSVLDLDEALDNIIHVIVRNMKLDKAAAIVLSHDPENETLIVKSVKSTGYKSKDIKLKEKNGLIEYFGRYIKKQKKETGSQTYIEEIETELKKTKLIKIEEKIKIQPIITDELERMLELSGEKNKLLNGVVKELKKLKTAVSMPIIVKGNLIGIFILGNKKSGDIFDSTGLNLLIIIANQTAVAIEKARFYERDQLKSEFVSIASHELLTPTSAIEGYLSMILDENMGKVDKRARGYLEKVYKSSQRLAKLVKDLLNVSRIEGRRIIIQSKNFDIRDLVKTVMSEIEPKAKEKNLKLIAEGIDREVPEVWADPEKVHQVLVSLASNSIKYTEQGTVTMKVNYSLSTIRVSLIDTGIGIKKHEISHLFEKFHWTSSADNQGAQGTGLGLYISKNIVELMGGMMRIDSEYGKGTTVSFSLPRGKIQSNNNKEK